MRHLIKLAALAAAVLATACTSDEPGRVAPPLLEVTSPARGTMEEGLTMVAVRGTVAPSPEAGAAITRVAVNGVTAELAADGSFVANVAIAPGATLLQTVAVDADGNQASDTRAVVTGTLRPADAMIENAISAALSAAALDRLGGSAATLVEQSDLGAFVAPYNPVIAKGLTNGEEDCLYGKVSVRPGLDVSTAAIGLVPGDAGLAIDVELKDLVVPLHARYAAACLDGDTDLTVRARRARVRGTLAVMATAGKFDVRLQSPQVTLEGFAVDASGVPGAVLDLLDLDQEMGDVLAWAIERFMAPVVDQALRGVAVGPQRVELLGRTVEVAVTPAGVGFDAAGAEVVLDGRLMVVGGDARFVYTEDQVPPRRTGAGFELAVADDTMNQALAGFWASGALALRQPHELGLFDGVALDARLPPVVSPAGDGSLRLALGDLIVDFQTAGATRARVAMNLEMNLRVEPNAAYDGAVRLAIDLRALKADVLDNATGVPDHELETLFPGIATTMLDTMSPILGAIPLPSVYDLSVTDLRVGGDAGYVTVSGELN